MTACLYFEENIFLILCNLTYHIEFLQETKHCKHIHIGDSCTNMMPSIKLTIVTKKSLVRRVTWQFGLSLNSHGLIINGVFISQ